jgi:hypothetical protein
MRIVRRQGEGSENNEGGDMADCEVAMLIGFCSLGFNAIKPCNASEKA